MNPDVDTELTDWCASYVIAFSAYDVAGISRQWSFPAIILSGRRSIVLKSREAFDANTDALLGFYKREGVAKAERRLRETISLGAQTAAMRVEDRMIDASGAVITGWIAGYTLRRTDEGWRALFADAGGELQAWAARGTPLGG